MNSNLILRFGVVGFGVLFIAAFAAMSWTQTPPAAKTIQDNAKLETAIFAGGCFWCVEANFEKIDGVAEVLSGYTGGHKENPTYEQVCSHTTGHLEAIKVTYDANLVTYNEMLEVFWRSVDPTDAGGQFVDRGEPYASAIFVADAKQRELAQASKQRLAESGRFEKPIVTPIRDAVKFYVAEDYHQDYYHTHPLKYKSYRFGSGRDQFIQRVWGDDAHYNIPKRSMSQDANKTMKWTDQPNSAYQKPAADQLKEQLSSIQHYVTQEEGTERPFSNEFWNEKGKGIFVDVVSGEPLFSSKAKYRSGTGWPSFYQPLVAGNVVERVDHKLLSARTEVRSKHGDSHLGHVFRDGPQPTGLRYCINSASLRFVPVDQLKAEGYESFLHLFETSSTN